MARLGPDLRNSRVVVAGGSTASALDKHDSFARRAAEQVGEAEGVARDKRMGDALFNRRDSPAFGFQMLPAGQ
jgi:hypothetical protein